MFISPKVAIENGWIVHPKCNTYEDFIERKFVSPNAIDFTIDKMFSLTKNIFVISEEDKQMRGCTELATVERDGTKYFKLAQGTVYDAMSDFYIEVPENVACTFIVRSTFNRNGVFVTSGLYDSGFKGNIGFAVHNRGGTTMIAPGTRIAQIIFHKSDSEGLYEGGYNHEQGTHWTESKTVNKPETTKKKSVTPTIEAVAKEIESEVNNVTEADPIPFESEKQQNN